MAGPNLLELLYGPHLHGALSTDATSHAAQYAGRTTIASGTTSVTVSTAMVNSDSLILMGREFNFTVGSNENVSTHVSTINPGNFFTVATDDNTNVEQDVTIMWLLLPTSDV